MAAAANIASLSLDPKPRAASRTRVPPHQCPAHRPAVSPASPTDVAGCSVAAATFGLPTLLPDLLVSRLLGHVRRHGHQSPPRSVVSLTSHPCPSRAAAADLPSPTRRCTPPPSPPFLPLAASLCHARQINRCGRCRWAIWRTCRLPLVSNDKMGSDRTAIVTSGMFA